MMDFGQLVRLVGRVQFPGYSFHASEDFVTDILGVYATYLDTDIVTGAEEMQKTRLWAIPRDWNQDQVVQTLFKCVLTSKEHYTREHFQYRGRSIFGPHFSVDALWDLAATVKEHP